MLIFLYVIACLCIGVNVENDAIDGECPQRCFAYTTAYITSHASAIDTGTSTQLAIQYDSDGSNEGDAGIVIILIVILVLASVLGIVCLIQWPAWC